MFGNPNISATPVDDLYRSQADTYGNSFANPVNPANMNSGWGIDSSLLSPSYTSQYRPSYSGSNGAVAGGRPGFFGGLNNLAPWSNTPGWANPDDHQQSSVDSVASRPVDAGMWAAQRIAMPVAAMKGAGALFGGYNSWGMGKGAASIGRSFGRGFGGGVARGIGAASGGMISRGLTAGMGGVFGAAAGWGLPMAAFQAASWAGEKAVFDPYINTRRSAENLRDNFSGITFGDAQGNASNGGGLGGAESSRMARQITTAGIKDMSLSTGEYGAAANMIGRSGLTDNVGSKDIVKRIKDSVDQMKLIMSIAQMPEMKDAIEQLSKLQKMGANVSGGAYSDAAGTMRQLGGLASVAGTNVQRMMNTVGAQGQYLYQSNGMTPYMGQIAAANSFASLSAGNRQGLISSAQLARLGGLEGATQATLTGELNASQTTYNKIANFNKYMGGGREGSTLGNLGQFGQSMSRNPMGVHGAMMLYGNQMAANQMDERGSLALDDQVWDMLKNMPGMVDPKTGKISIEKATPILTQMGMSIDQIQAYATKRVSETNTGVYQSSMKAINRNLTEQNKQYIEQNTLYGGTLGKSVHGIMKAGRNITSDIGDITGGTVASVEGSLRDTVGRAKDNLWYGNSILNRTDNFEDAYTGKNVDRSVQGFDIDSIKRKTNTKDMNHADIEADYSSWSRKREIAKELNDAKSKGDNNALAYFKATTPEGRRSALNAYKESGKMSKKLDEFYSDPVNYKNINKDLEGVGRTTKKGTSLGEGVLHALADTFGFGSNDTKVSESGSALLARVGGMKNADVADNARLAGSAYELMTGDQSLTPSNIEEAMKNNDKVKAFAKARGLTDPQDVLIALRDTAKGVVDNGLVGITTSSLKVKGTGKDALKAAANRIGGSFLDQNAPNTKDMNFKDTMGASMATKAADDMRGQLFDKYKEGHLDFSGFQNSMNALDNKKAVKDFADAVGTFKEGADLIAGAGGNRKPNDAGNLWGALGRYKEGSGQGGQKTFK